MAKRIVVCCDGTWNTPDESDRGVPTATNVTKVALAVAPRDAGGVEQRVYYEKGVGTGRWDRLRGGAFGRGLSQKIKHAYRFVVANYEPGDELFFFGFSRGAYTARSTVGFIRNSGLLKREYADRVDEAYALYRRRDDASHPSGVEAELFRRTYGHEPGVKFVGVWDTVGALGIPGTLLRFANWRYRFHDVKLSRVVEHAYQALAIDERRRFFGPAAWEQQEGAEGQVLEQVWFAGVHCNVGGGYRDTGLSDIALLWMIGKAHACGLAFDGEQLAKSVKANALGELRDSMTLFYRVFGSYVRPIGRAVGGRERVASSVTARQRQEPRYDPENVERFLQQGGEEEKVP